MNALERLRDVITERGTALPPMNFAVAPYPNVVCLKLPFYTLSFWRNDGAVLLSNREQGHAKRLDETGARGILGVLGLEVP